MKKFGILCLALVIALGTLGVGYAAWTDTIYIDGTVNTGEVCLSIQPGTFEEVGGCPDKEWSGWVYDGFSDSCPDGYHFGSISVVPEGKCVASVTFNPILDADDNITTLEVTIHDAYPHFVADISFYVCNCGTIPIKIKAPVITQSPYLLIEYGNNIGVQLHPDVCKEISFKVGVVQHEGYFGYATPDSWIVDDPAAPLTPMDDTLTFTIEIEGIQWNEY
ncbi:hypothetical protein ES708_08465 [subsurface metagenome]